MKINSTFYRYCLLLFILCASPFLGRAQQNFATTTHTGAAGLLCLNCTVDNAANAADGNLQSFSTLNVSVGLAASTFEELIFPGSKVPANTAVSVKLGSGNHLLDVTALGGITLQAYNGNATAGSAIAASTLISAVSNNNEVELKFAPTATYDRIRVTLNGGLLGVLSSIYVYEAFYFGPTAVPCNTPVDEIHGSSAGLLNLGVNVGGVANPQLAFDGNPATFSTLNAGVGVVGAFTQQTIIFQSLSTVGDSVKVTMGVPSALLAASVLSSVSVATYNGNVNNGDSHAVNSGLLNLQLLDLTNNVQRFTITFAPTKIFDRIEVTLGGGIANVLSSLNVYEIDRSIPSPIIKYNNVVTNNVQLCAGSVATLMASTPAPNSVFNWYTTATGGASFFKGSTYTTPVLTATTTYYVSASRPGCSEESVRAPVTITVSQIPGAPAVINSAVTVCPGQPANFAVTPVTGITINWYTTATNGTPVFTGNNFTTGALTANATYYAEAVAGGTCISPTRTAVTATVSALPAVPVLTVPNPTVCDGDVAVLSVNTQAGTTFNWYTAATNGVPIFTGANFTTPALHANTTYYVEAVNANGCNSSTRAQAIVTVQPKPVNPTLAANNSTIAAGQTANILVTNSQTGIVYNWYTSNTAATPVFTGVAYLTPQLYATTTYYVSATNANGCQSASRTAITINVTINNNSPCTFASQQTSSTSGVLCLGCSVTNNALATDADTTTASTLNVPIGLLGGYVEQKLQFQQAGFAGDTVKLVFQTPVNLADVSLLGNISVTLYNGNTALTTYPLNSALITLRLLGGNGKYAVYIPATGPYDRVAIRLNSGVATLLTSLQIYYASQQYPKPVFANANPEVCKGSPATLTITGPANGTFKWYDQPTNGTLLTTGTSYTSGPLNANTTYYVEYSRGTCVSPVRYPIQVIVNDPPVKPAVAPTATTIFAGQTATFTATSVNNSVINWYDAPTSGNLVHTGTTFTTPALSADKSYYAEAVTGTCPSPDRTKVTVTVTPVVIPNVTVTPPTQSINVGTSASLTASSTTPGVKFNWYTTPTNGTIVFTGATFNTPNLFANTTYYAEAVVIATGAVSATRASGVVTVNNPLVDPVHCDAAIAETPATTGLLCLLCAVNNEQAAVDADRNTFSQINVPVSLLGNYAQQTLRFAATGRAGDSVVVELGIPGTLISAGVLSQISLATYNGATYNNDRFNLDGALITLNLLNGTNRFRIAFKAGSDFDRVEIRLNAVVANVLSSLNVYDAYQEVAAPVISVPSLTACSGSQVTLIATASSDATIKWYTSATGGSPVFTGASFTTPVLSATTKYYAEASRTSDGCVQNVRTPATVTVTPIPAAPVVAAPNVTVCSGQVASFTAQAVSGVTFNWYAAAAGGAPIFTGGTFTTGPLSSTISYYVEATGAGQCGSSTRTQVTATVTPTPVVPVVPASPVQVCANGITVLTATSPQAGVTFNWYAAANGGAPIFTGAQFTTPALTANTSYFVEAASGTCTSSTRARIDVVVNPAPVAPVVAIAEAGGQISSGQVAHLTATSTTAGVIFNWYTSATGGTSFFTGASYTTPILTTNTTYYVESALTATGCTSPTRTKVTVIVNPIFSTSCDFASTQSINVNGGVLCLGCAVNTPNEVVDTDTTNFSQLQLPIGLLGSFVSQQLIFADHGIVGDTVAVKIALPVSLLSAGVLNQLQIRSYNGATANPDQLLLNSGLIKLQILSGGKTALIKFAPGATFDRVEIKLSGAALSLFSTVNIYYASKQVAAPQLSVNTMNICANNTATFTLTNPRPGVTYTWYDAPVGGHVLATGTTYTTGALTTTTTIYVESSRTSSGCINPNRAAATINVTPAPVNPILTQNNLQICSGDNVILSVTNGAGVTINWYDAPTGGNLLFVGNNFQVSPIANADYYVEFTNGSCNSSARIHATVKVNQRPSKPGVQAANVQTCTGSPATLQVTTAEAGVTYNWYDAQVGGTLKFTGATVTTGNITQNVTYYVEAVNTVSGCINNAGRTAVTINVSNQVNAPTLDATQTAVCSGGSVALSVVNPTAGLQYKWYTDATTGTAVFTGTTFNITNITANISYYVEASNGTGCVSSTRTRTDITVNPIPTAPVVSSPAGGLTVCEGNSTTLTISDPQPDLVYRWFDAPTNGTLLYVGTQFVTPALTAATNYYVQASDAGMCSSSTLTEVTVNITPIPADPTVNSNNPQVCYGTAATLSITSPQTGIVYNWYDSPTRTNLLFTGTTYVTDPIIKTTNYYVASANASGCTSGNLVQIQVTTEDLPPTPVIANGSAVQTCTGSTVTLTIGNPQPGYTYNWYTISAGGTAVGTGTTFTANNVTSDITYYAEAVNTTGCSNAVRASVGVTVIPPPGAPQLGADNVTACPGGTATLSVTNNDPTVTIKWYSDAAATNLVATGNTFTTPVLTADTVYYAQASNSNGCTSTIVTASVTIAKPLVAPVVSVGTTTASSVTFQWSAIDGAVEYEVSLDNGTTFKSAGTATSYTVSGLEPNQSVTIIVRAVSPCQPGANSQAVTGKSTNPFGDGIYVPNAFTPNGDGKNDILYVYGTNIKSVSLWIYDQWGELQFTSNTQGSGWDGTYKGRAQPVGVYVYYVKATMNDGQLITKKGTVTLLR